MGVSVKHVFLFQYKSNATLFDIWQKVKQMLIENNAMSCNRFLLLVRDFSLRVKPYQTAIRYHVKPDEIYDLTKISQRVYGRRDEYLVVMAVAGLSTMDQPIEVQTLVLPTEEQLALLKQQAGFNNDAVKRLFTKK